MASPIIYLANRGGIPRIKSNGVSVSTTNVAFSFNATPTFSSDYAGLVLVKLDQPIPSGTTTTLPVVFTSQAGTQALTTLSNAAVTVSDIAGTGIFLCYYEKASNLLQVLTGLTI